MSLSGQKPRKRLTIAYFRVSSHAQRKDSESQKQAVEQLCIASGRILDEKLEDIGSGLNYKRKNFVELITGITHENTNSLSRGSIHSICQ